MFRQSLAHVFERRFKTNGLGFSAIKSGNAPVNFLRPGLGDVVIGKGFLGKTLLQLIDDIGAVGGIQRQSLLQDDISRRHELILPCGSYAIEFSSF